MALLYPRDISYADLRILTGLSALADGGRHHQEGK